MPSSPTVVRGYSDRLLEPAKEIVFRLKLLLQALHNAKRQFESLNRKGMTPEQIEKAYTIWNKLRAEVIISKEIDKEKARARIAELTRGFETIPWTLIDEDDIQRVIDQAYQEIGEI